MDTTTHDASTERGRGNAGARAPLREVPIRDVIPVAPWNACATARPAGDAHGAGVQVVLAARVPDVERLRGAAVFVVRPDGGRRAWVVSGVETHRGDSVLFLGGASADDVPAGSRVSWAERAD